MSTFRAPDGTSMRLIGNSLLVRMDAPPTRSEGGILFSNPKAAAPYATGEVLAVGFVTGKKAHTRVEIPGLSVGDHVVFLRLLSVTDSNPRIQNLLEDSVVCIRPSDVLLVFAAEDASRLR